MNKITNNAKFKQQMQEGLERYYNEAYSEGIKKGVQEAKKVWELPCKPK